MVFTVSITKLYAGHKTHESDYRNVSDTRTNRIKVVSLLNACHSSSRRKAICDVQVASDRQRCPAATNTPKAPGVSNYIIIVFFSFVA